MSQFRVQTSYLNTSNLTDLGTSLTPFINNFENINVINTFTGNNAYVNNLTIGGSLTGGTNGQNVYFTGIGIQISGAIFSTNTFIPLIFSKNGKVVTLAFGEADNGIGVGRMEVLWIFLLIQERELVKFHYRFYQVLYIQVLMDQIL